MTARLIPTQFPGHGCIDDLITERSFYSQATRVINVLSLIFDMLSMGNFYKALTGVRSNGPGIKCLYSIIIIRLNVVVVYSRPALHLGRKPISRFLYHRDMNLAVESDVKAIP